MEKRVKSKKNKSHKSILQRKIDWKRFYANNVYRQEILYFIKEYQYSHSPKETLQFLNTLPIQCKNLLHKDLLGKELNQLNDIKLGYFVDDLKVNLLHMLNLFILFSKHIENFNKIKFTFEKLFLQGELEQSNIILEDSIKRFGYTNWYLSNKFLVEEHLNRFEGNFKLLKNITTNGANHPLNYIFSFSFSRLAEQDLAIENYKKNLEIDYYSYYKVSDNLKEFLKIYIDPLDVFDSKNLNGIFIGESRNSLIDQYLTFKKILINLLKNNPDLCKELLDKTINNINDIHLKKIRFLLNSDLDFLELNNEYISTFLILDLYTEGKYDECIDLIKNHIFKFEISIDLIEIYVKCHINLHLKLEHLVEKNSFLNLIMDNIYNILYKTKKTEESINKLKIFALSLRNFNISMQISHFINKMEQSGNKKLFLREYQIFLPVITPQIIHNFKDDSIKSKILSKLYNENNKTIIFFKKLLDFKDTEIITIDDFSIPEKRLLLHTSRILFKNKNYEVVISNLQPLLPELLTTPHIYENYLLMIYESYSKLRKYQECINLYVDNYFKNKYLLNNINTIHENKFISNLGYKDLEKNLDLILFVHICKIESKILFLIYRLFMRKIQMKQPSMIDKKLFPLDKLIYFLRYVCVPEVISKDASNFETLNAVESERLRVCQLLVTIDPDNSKIYNDEISEITQNINIKERIREIDYGKIHVDIKGLINYDLKDFDSNFSRFKRVKDVNEDIYKIVTNNGTMEGDIQDYRKKIVTQHEQLWSIFIELFVEIRNKYLFSNEHGLDSYLSTRIRHGTITGQFRKIFKELELITKKDSESKLYKDNIYWTNVLNLNEKELNEFNYIMNDFSYKIDDYISYIKDYLIQIKTENSSDALFDFNIYIYLDTLRTQFSEFMEIEDSSEFINKSIKICNFITDLNLERIKIFFEKNIQSQFSNLINDLEKDITNININNNNFLPVLTNIRKARTEIQTNINTIRSWFERKEIKHVNFELSDVIDTSKEIIKNIFHSISINVHLSNNNYNIFEGRYFINFVDCFKIFFENILDYVQEKNEKKADIFINIINEDDYFTCTIINKLFNSNEKELSIIDGKIKKKEQEILEAMESIANRTEGNTGIIKATKILKRSLNNTNNKINFSRDGDQIIIEFTAYKKGLVYEDTNN